MLGHLRQVVRQEVHRHPVRIAPGLADAHEQGGDRDGRLAWRGGPSGPAVSDEFVVVRECIVRRAPLDGRVQPAPIRIVVGRHANFEPAVVVAVVLRVDLGQQARELVIFDLTGLALRAGVDRRACNQREEVLLQLGGVLERRAEVVPLVVPPVRVPRPRGDHLAAPTPLELDTLQRVDALADADVGELGGVAVDPVAARVHERVLRDVDPGVGRHLLGLHPLVPASGAEPLPAAPLEHVLRALVLAGARLVARVDVNHYLVVLEAHANVEALVDRPLDLFRGVPASRPVVVERTLAPLDASTVHVIRSVQDDQIEFRLSVLGEVFGSHHCSVASLVLHVLHNSVSLGMGLVLKLTGRSLLKDQYGKGSNSPGARSLH